MTENTSSPTKAPLAILYNFVIQINNCEIIPMFILTYVIQQPAIHLKRSVYVN